jgi:hypothetical protein
VAHALVRAVLAIVPTPKPFTIVNAARTSAQCHLVFLCVNILKDLCLIARCRVLRRWCAMLEGQRSHECERGTQECVRHNDFNHLYHLGEN